MASWYLFMSRLSSPSVCRWSALENPLSLVMALISSALPHLKLRYFYFSDITAFSSPSLDFLTRIVLRSPTMGERVFVFTKKKQGKKVSWIIFSTHANASLCPRWHVVEIFTLILLHISLRHNYPGEIYLRFCWSWWFFNKFDIIWVAVTPSKTGRQHDVTVRVDMRTGGRGLTVRWSCTIWISFTDLENCWCVGVGGSALG